MPVCVTIKLDGQKEKRTELYEGESLLHMLLRQENGNLSFCGGRGICGKCRIRFFTSPPFPTMEERRFLTPDELRLGIRLACMCHPKEDCTISTFLFKHEEIKAVEQIVSVCKMDTLQKYVWNDDKVGKNILAIDLGTTTIAFQLRDLVTGEILSEHRMMNPQRSYGYDVVSRMMASMEGKKEQLQKITVDVIEKEIDKLLEGKAATIVIAGNVVMTHILLGLDMTTLSTYPFTPVTLGQETCKIGKYEAVLLPGISAFVGGDITAGIYATGMGHDRNDAAIDLLVDLGTNGEIVIGNGKKMIATSTAAGPAFEGRNPMLQGTDMITTAAELLEKGVLDQTGLLSSPYFEKGYPYGNVVVIKEDIRALQTAKAAICAGIRIVMDKMQIDSDKIRNVYLAGGFGYLIDVKKADRIGLLPEGLAEKTIPVGNTSLYGAYLYERARIYEKTLENGAKNLIPKEICSFLERITTINLAEESAFQSLYIGEMNFK